MPPSSPPHATATNRSSSPFFEPTYNAYSPKSSSPPPLFSSDDSRESIDVANYKSPRIFKNKRKGAWWDNGGSSQNSPAVKKARMTRNYDSGVYMLSDGTDSSESLPAQHKSPFGLDGTCDSPPPEEPLPQPELLGQNERNFCRRMYTGLEKNSEVYDFSALYLEDGDIRRIGELSSVIKSAPDPGNELPAEGQYRSMVPQLYVNLRDNRLSRLTPALFGLQNLTTLIITGNNIEELPSQISQLRNLRELNISRNNIKWLPYEFLGLFRPQGHPGIDIIGDSGVPWLLPKTAQVSIDPPEIGHLDSLDHQLRLFIMDSQSEVDLLTTPEMQTLHAAIDALSTREQHVWLMKTYELSASAFNRQRGTCLRPDIWNFDEPGFFSHHPTVTYIDSVGGDIPRYYARTPVSYFDEAGALVKGSPKPPTSNEDDFAVITETMRGAHGVPLTWFTPTDFKAVNSLATMALHAALRHKDQEDLSIADLRHHIGEPLPPVAEALLKQAEINDGGGYGEFKQCHVCSKEYVIARAQWIEWWSPKYGVILPFKVQVCSWACVPDAMRTRPEKELAW